MKKFKLFFSSFCIISLLTNCGGERSLDSESGELSNKANTTDSKRFVRKCLNQQSRRRGIQKTRKNLAVPAYSATDLPYIWETQPYTLVSDKNSVTLKLTLDIDYQTSEATTPSIKNRMEGIRYCMTDFFKKHDLNLEIHFPAFIANETDQNAAVTFLDNADPYTTYDLYHWSFHMNDYELISPIDCTIITHEVGHILGLNDEYEDPLVPDRVIGEENSIMRGKYVPPNQLKFYPRHLKTILAPLCPDISI